MIVEVYNAAKIFKNLFILIFSIHIFSCAWIFIGSFKTYGEEGWIEYPKKKGKVIYIGKATTNTTIGSRLVEHRARNKGNPNLYSFFRHKTLKIRYVHLGSTDENLKRKEVLRFQDHFDRHGNVPIANRQGPVKVKPGD